MITWKMFNVLKTTFQMFCLMVGCFRWEGRSGCFFSNLARSKSLWCIFFFKPICFLKNPRRLPTQEKNMMGEEAHIYVKTVSGSEESTRDTHRPAVEVERRRGLWWLIPRLSLEWGSEPSSRAGAGSELNIQGSIVPGVRREAKLLLNHAKLHLQVWKTSGLILLFKKLIW